MNLEQSYFKDFITLFKQPTQKFRYPQATKNFFRILKNSIWQPRKNRFNFKSTNLFICNLSNVQN